MYKYLFILGFIYIALLQNPIKAEEFVWDDDGLIVIDSSEPVDITYSADGDVDIKVSPSSEPTFIYGHDELTVIQETDFGIISY